MAADADLERLGIPATFFVNARCTEVYPDAVKQIAKSGFDIAAHSYTQDDLPSYFPPEEQDKLIRKSIDMLQGCAGKKVTGWGSPVVAFTPETAGLLKQERPVLDLRRHLCRSADQDPHAARADRRRADHRLLRQPRAARLLARPLRCAPRHLRLSAQARDIGLQTLVIHSQFGGRPLITAVLIELLKYMGKSRDAWFTTHEALADWALSRTSTSTPSRAGISS